MSQAEFDQLCDLVRQEVGRTRVPGFALGLLRGGEEFAAGFGVTNVQNPQAVDGDTLFQIGSITKTFTATAATSPRRARSRLAASATRWCSAKFRLADFL